MVDVSGKAATKREAVAGATVQLGPTAFEALSDNAKGELAPLSLPWLFAAREAQHLSELPWTDTPLLEPGDVLAVARVAGVLAAKRTADLIPLCHPLLISHASVPPAAGGLGARPFRLRAEPLSRSTLSSTPPRTRCTSPRAPRAPRVCGAARRAGAAGAGLADAAAARPAGTGVEMEAMTAASVAALTVYDMCKAASKGIVISELRLLRKSGGKSGEWRARVEERGASATAPV